MARKNVFDLRANTFTDSFGNVLHAVHSPMECELRRCVVHAPSDHHMREWPLLWRADRRIFERICPHGVGHPDPDDDVYHTETLGDPYSGTHGCDGCCRTR